MSATLPATACLLRPGRFPASMATLGLALRPPQGPSCLLLGCLWVGQIVSECLKPLVLARGFSRAQGAMWTVSDGVVGRAATMALLGLAAIPRPVAELAASVVLLVGLVVAL